jgi:hypothetical protein
MDISSDLIKKNFVENMSLTQCVKFHIILRKRY